MTLVSRFTSLVGVIRCVGRIVTILALCCAIGLHWIALQSVAWTTMVIEYSKHAPLCQAITQTFDGAHPCSLCHAVNTGKNSDKKSDFQSPTPKIDMIWRRAQFFCCRVLSRSSTRRAIFPHLKAEVLHRFRRHARS
ncbi:MAG: hypothetical protein DMF17_05875 [Verrucomicrobia bacterium]|nr:MAG: hypothetical protein DMF17_05875 [Verrucomicrobiota bacterium]